MCLVNYGFINDNGPNVSRCKTFDLSKDGDEDDDTVLSSGCSLECTNENGGSNVGNNCRTYQFPLVDASGAQVSTDPCPTVTWTKYPGYMAPEIYSGGRLYYCKDASITEDAKPCAQVLEAQIYNQCNDKWAQLYNLGDSDNWKISCKDFAQKLVKEGKYKAVGCYNASETDFGIEVGQYAQAWPSSGYDVSPNIFANSLACQLNKKYEVTECDTLGNLCDTGMFGENFSSSGKSQIFQKSSGEALETIGAIVEAIGES